MVTISQLAKKIISEKPFLQEAMSRGIISYGSLAEQLQSKIEKELGKKAKLSAIVMALRRYAEEIEETTEKFGKFNYKSEIVLKTNIMDLCVLKTQAMLSKIKQLYSLVNFEKGDTLNIIVGNNEISIIMNEKYKENLLKFLKEEKVLTKEFNLISLTITFSEDFLHTPGVIFNACRKLAWEGINIYEIVSTDTELTFILHKKDSMKAYDALQELIEG